LQWPPRRTRPAHHLKPFQVATQTALRLSLCRRFGVPQFHLVEVALPFGQRQPQAWQPRRSGELFEIVGERNVVPVHGEAGLLVLPSAAIRPPPRPRGWPAPPLEQWSRDRLRHLRRRRRRADSWPELDSQPTSASAWRPIPPVPSMTVGRLADGRDHAVQIDCIVVVLHRDRFAAGGIVKFGKTLALQAYAFNLPEPSISIGLTMVCKRTPSCRAPSISSGRCAAGMSSPVRR